MDDLCFESSDLVRAGQALSEREIQVEDWNILSLFFLCPSMGFGPRLVQERENEVDVLE